MTDDARFERLLGLYVDGRAVPEELAELEELLRQDAALRAAFVDRIRVHVDLHALYEGSPEEAALTKATAPAARPPSRRFSARDQAASPSFPWVPGLVAAAILIGFTAILLWSASGEPSAPSRRSGTQVRRDEGPRVERPTADVRPATPERNVDVPKPGPRKKEIEDPAERQRRIDEELKAATRPPAVADTKKSEQPTPPTPEAPNQTTIKSRLCRLACTLDARLEVLPRHAEGSSRRGGSDQPEAHAAALLSG